jgi:hypothetical protein
VGSPLAAGLVIGFALGGLVAWLTAWMLIGRMDLPRKALIELVRAEAARAAEETTRALLPRQAFEERQTRVESPRTPSMPMRRRRRDD